MADALSEEDGIAACNNGGTSAVEHGIDVLSEFASIRSNPVRLQTNSVPIEHMLELMEKYGPLYNSVKTRSSGFTSKNAIRRKFARWFPDFVQSFRYDHDSGKFVPLLGEDKELLRRELSRRRRSRFKVS